MIIKLKNGELSRLSRMLFDLELKSKESRMRTRLVLILDDFIVNTIQREFKELLDKYGEKDEIGNIKETIVNGMQEYSLIPATEHEYHAEFAELMNEEYIITIDESNKEMMTYVANSLLNSNAVYSKDDAVFYDIMCEKFEAILD